MYKDICFIVNRVITILFKLINSFIQDLKKIIKVKKEIKNHFLKRGLKEFCPFL
jgi:hypothetical protein